MDLYCIYYLRWFTLLLQPIPHFTFYSLVLISFGCAIWLPLRIYIVVGVVIYICTFTVVYFVIRGSVRSCWYTLDLFLTLFTFG